MKPLIGIYGAGGCGSGIMPLERKMSAFASERLVFIDDGLPNVGLVNGQVAMSFNEFVETAASSKQIAIAISNPSTRRDIARRVTDLSNPIVSIWAEQTHVMDDVTIGEGALVSPFVTVTSNIQVG